MNLKIVKTDCSNRNLHFDYGHHI